MAIMVSIPAGVLANQQTASAAATNLGNIINQTSASINQTSTQIDCSLAPSFSGFGFRNFGGHLHRVEVVLQLVSLEAVEQVIQAVSNLVSSVGAPSAVSLVAAHLVVVNQIL